MELEMRVTELDERKKELDRREKELDRREKELERRAMELDRREKKLDRGETPVRRDSKEIDPPNTRRLAGSAEVRIEGAKGALSSTLLKCKMKNGTLRFRGLNGHAHAHSIWDAAKEWTDVITLCRCSAVQILQPVPNRAPKEFDRH
ncbi:hypothetical protein DPX16_10921 [Anabarilius grahami]|uniref:Uncharacterized protein n=1 Tax=Anabarilius grahami TaxID=495550 RepID=A0A3N0XVD2_ANAGA|nr:hypothetical protein DPX16_10921 [Anabarilius grahami]